ncbi:Bug family tripartite tricarboxylate transporter substrate binding protein [Bordetella trematum]|uniref:Bug family tripartite tricarboxylate transporter substrate binding protein n=1 Tax=Bordetella trematum TaxID=123899 RepID=UPI0013FD4A40|nr:tripartite tricarboxylate transporter substrate binding protein [Bordetella trematum]
MHSGSKKWWSGVAALSAFVMAMGAAPEAQAAYPEKPITLVVPFPAGGGVDLVARMLAQHMGQHNGANVVIENRPGAGGSIGVASVARSAPDGYTLVMGSPGNISIAPSAYPSLPYDPVKDLSAIGMAVQMPILLVAQPKASFNSVKELIAQGKEKPGSLTYGSGGTGTSLHLSGELLAHLAGLEAVHVPYKGSTPALTDLMGGRLDYMFVDTSAMPNVSAGKIRLLAVTAPQRSQLLPDTPTIAESGLPAYQTLNWYGLFAPAGVNPEAARWLRKALDEALADPELIKRLNAQMLEAPPAMTPAQFGEFVAEDVAKWRQLVNDAKLNLNG